MKQLKDFIVKMIEGVLILLVLLSGANNIFAEEPVIDPVPTPDPVTVGLTIRSGTSIIFENKVALQAPGNIELSGHQVNTHSVLAILNYADSADDSWNISDLKYYDSFGSFYLKCLASSMGENCDDWQYVVNGTSPYSSIDQSILSGGENVYLYFSPQNKIILSSNSITENDTVTVTTQKYDYENNTWSTRTGVTVGLTQPNPADAYNPTEVKTDTVNETGQVIFSKIAVGDYNVGVKEDYYFPIEALKVAAAPAPTPTNTGSSGGGSSSGGVIKNYTPETKKYVFDIKKAFDFLISQQKEDGSFGEEIYTDWAAVALATGNSQEQIIKLVKYFGEYEIVDSKLTDYERHAMALLALGINPYNANGENYIEKITSSFNGKQFGDPKEDNDDIFALIVLQNAGFGIDEKIIKDDVDFILSRQKGNGSWDESIDMTGAAIEALASIAEKSCFLLGSLSAPVGAALPLGSPACETPKNKELLSAMLKAKEFLKQNQKDDGGWGNVSSTAWAIEGILALKEKPEEWIKNKNTPFDYLATQQDIDGGIKSSITTEISEENKMKNKIWETAYVLKAYSNKTWNEIMQKFKKPTDFGITLETEKTKTKKIPEKINKTLTKNIQSVQGLSLHSTANVIDSIKEKNIPETQTSAEPKKKNWVVRFLNIFW